MLAAQQQYGYRHGIMIFPATGFYELTIDPWAPPGQRARLAALPVPALPTGTVLHGVGLSPDGSRLAVSSSVIGTHRHGSFQSRLRVFDLRTGSARTRYAPGFAAW